MNVCEICLKTFDRKAGLTQHKKKKIPCKPVVLPAQPIETLQIQNTAVSLFSGCGGDTLGLERAGFKVIAFSELKKTFATTHLENFPE
jgi:hypothetical protein